MVMSMNHPVWVVKPIMKWVGVPLSSLTFDARTQS
jgi:hypothetical protein